MSAPDRVAWASALRTVIAIAEEHPEVPVPAVSTGIGGHTVTWWLYGERAAAHMAALEAALPCELTASVEPGAECPDHYRLLGEIGGFRVKISAPAEMVASLTVTEELVEKREWARRPVEPETAEGEASA